MRELSIALIIFLFMISCVKSVEKDKIIGGWCYESKLTGLVKFKFSEDRVQIKDKMGMHYANWNLGTTKLELSIIDSDYLLVGEEFQYNYELIENGTKLYLKIKGDSIAEFNYFHRCDSEESQT